MGTKWQFDTAINSLSTNPDAREWLENEIQRLCESRHPLTLGAISLLLIKKITSEEG